MGDVDFDNIGRAFNPDEEDDPGLFDSYDGEEGEEDEEKVEPSFTSRFSLGTLHIFEGSSQPALLGARVRPEHRRLVLWEAPTGTPSMASR